MSSGFQFVKKHASFSDELCTVCLGAFGSQGGKQESLATQGFRNHRKGERSEPRREDSAKRSAEPKPKPDRRLGLGRNTCRCFRIGNQRAAALRYLWGFIDILRAVQTLLRNSPFVYAVCWICLRQTRRECLCQLTPLPAQRRFRPLHPLCHPDPPDADPPPETPAERSR